MQPVSGSFYVHAPQAAIYWRLKVMMSNPAAIKLYHSLQVLILGAGPNRIGQGIEFDYCCCHASFSLR